MSWPSYIQQNWHCDDSTFLEMVVQRGVRLLSPLIVGGHNRPYSPFWEQIRDEKKNRIRQNHIHWGSLQFYMVFCVCHTTRTHTHLPRHTRKIVDCDYMLFDFTFTSATLSCGLLLFRTLHITFSMDFLCLILIRFSVRTKGTWFIRSFFHSHYPPYTTETHT